MRHQLVRLSIMLFSILYTTASFSPAFSESFKLRSGKQFSLCREFTSHLNTLPMNINFSNEDLIPESKNFRHVKWKKENHDDVLKIITSAFFQRLFFYSGLSNEQSLNGKQLERWQSRKPLIESFSKKEYSLKSTSIDLYNLNNKYKVYKAVFGDGLMDIFYEQDNETHKVKLVCPNHTQESGYDMLLFKGKAFVYTVDDNIRLRIKLRRRIDLIMYEPVSSDNICMEVCVISYACKEEPCP